MDNCSESNISSNNDADICDISDISDNNDISYNNLLSATWYEFINELLNINKYISFPNIESNHILLLKQLDNNEIISQCSEFNELLQQAEYFNLFIKRKIKVFSHKNDHTYKISISLLSHSIPLKELLNDKTNKIKNIIWGYLFKINLYIEQLKPNKNTLYINKLKNSLKELDIDIKTKPDLFNIDNLLTNEGNSNLINDITNSFNDVLNNNNQSDFLGNILNISKNMAEKYKDDIDIQNIDIKNILNKFTQELNNSDMLQKINQ